MIVNAVRYAIAAIALLAAPAMAQDRSAEREFAESVVPQVARVLPDVTIAPDADEPLQLNLSGHPEWDDASINLHRIYNFCLSATKEQCQTEIEGLLTVLAQDAPEYGPENLRIIVRDADYWSYVLEAWPEGEMPAYQQIGDDLFAILALDSTSAITIAPLQDVEEMGLSLEQAWDTAWQQTRSAIPNVPIDEASDLTEGMVFFEGEEYVASVLYDLENWQKMAEQLGPNMVVSAISDQFAVLGIIEPSLLDGFKEAVRGDCDSAPRCVSPNVYQLRAGMWRLAD